MQNRTAHDRVEHAFSIAQGIRILDLILNIWRGRVGPGDLQKLRRDVNRDDLRSRACQLPSKSAGAASQLEHSHPGFEMAAEHFYSPSPAKFSSWTFPIPNLPCPVLCEKTAVLNFFGNSLLHQKRFK